MHFLFLAAHLVFICLASTMYFRSLVLVTTSGSLVSLGKDIRNCLSQMFSIFVCRFTITCALLSLLLRPYAKVLCFMSQTRTISVRIHTDIQYLLISQFSVYMNSALMHLDCTAIRFHIPVCLRSRSPHHHAGTLHHSRLWWRFVRPPFEACRLRVHSPRA